VTTNQAPAASARPDIISLDVLLKDVDEGRIRIPRFQRPYVWTPQMMRELFQSVLSGYPIGSLLFWEPREFDVATMEHVGPLPTPEPSTHSPVSLVLDGHQRLATLYGVLRLGDNHPHDSNTSLEQLSWWIGYDLEAQEARQMRPPDDFKDPKILPLRSVLRTAEFVRFARGIDAAALFTDEQKATYLDRADEVQRKIRDYRVALTTMRDGTVDDAVAIFSRINRSGRPITSDQMAVALTYQEGFNLEEVLDSILGRLDPFGFGDVSRTIILQSLLHGAGRNFVKPNFDDLRKQNTRDAIRNAVEPVAESLCDAASFLNNIVGFKTGRLLPYALQLFLLGVFFRSCANDGEGTGATEKPLVRWFWATSFEGWFASANSSEIERSVRAMETFARSDKSSTSTAAFEAIFIDRPLRPFPKTFDRRSARIRAMLLVQMARGQLVDPITKENIDGSALMADPDRRDLPYVFRPAGNKISRSPANRILLPRMHGSAVRDVLASHLSSREALASHAIDEEGIAAIAEKDLVKFVIAREAELARQEAEFLRRFGLLIGDAIERSDEEVDIEEG
jgi:hypothetical protein